MIGTTLHLVSDSSDVNSSTFGTGRTTTGKLTSIDLATGSATTVAIYSGVGALAANQGATSATLYSAGNDKQQQIGSASATAGPAVDHTAAKVARKLWLRTN